MGFTFHYLFAHLEGLQLFHENFTIENVFLVWLCKVFMMRISFFGLYVEANLVVYMMMDNLSKLVCSEIIKKPMVHIQSLDVLPFILKWFRLPYLIILDQ
jgi:hypothetical protein